MVSKRVAKTFPCLFVFARRRALALCSTFCWQGQITAVGKLMALRTPNTIATIRLESSNNNGAHPPPHPPPPSRNSKPVPRLSLSKPSWIVRTESNVRKEKRRIPDPPCVVCKGSGRVRCHDCCGRGRTNFVELSMLPKGEWPKWCRTCGGSGLSYCSRCLGTGEYRDIMGFQFMKSDSAQTHNHSHSTRRRTADDLLLSDSEEIDPNKEDNNTA